MLNFINILKTVQFRLTAGSKVLFVLFFLFHFSAQSQIGLNNIVPNPDFEVYDTCPVNFSSPGDMEIEHCINWYSPTSGATSDYFNVCNSSTVGIPANALGFQAAHSGNAYCGLLAFVLQGECTYREYIQSKLNYPLEAGNSYHLEFYVSYSAKVTAAVTKLGALLTTNRAGAGLIDCPLFASPQVQNETGYLTDTTNWVKIEGTFTASGGEEYITIGYFENVGSSDIYYYSDDTVGGATIFSYYYIDDITLVQTASNLIIPNIITPNNDGANDVLSLVKYGLKQAHLEIYNRWGELVYKSTDVNAVWDGKNKRGFGCDDGVYYYVLDAITTSEKKENIKGFIQLLR